MRSHSILPLPTLFLFGFLLVPCAAETASIAPLTVTLDTLGTWTRIADCPVPHAYHSAIWDPVRDRMLVFGGYTYMDQEPKTNDTWALSLSGTPAWSLLQTVGSAPAMYHHAAIYDPIRDRMIIYAGGNNLWALNLFGTPTWQQLNATGSPPPFVSADGLAVYDSARDRLLVTGDGVWELPLSGPAAWSQIVPSGTGYHGLAVYDPAGDRVIAGTWELPLGGPLVWQQMAPSGTPAQGYGTAVLDPMRKRIVRFGGFYHSCDPGPTCESYGLTEAKVLVLDASPRWQALRSGPGKYAHSAIYALGRDRMVVMGGESDAGLDEFALADTWIFEWALPADVPDRVTPFGLRLVGSNPAHGVATFELDVSEAGEFAVSVYDIRGARVADLARAPFALGHHSLQWSGIDASGHRAPAGIYFVRAATRHGVATARVAFIE